MSRQPGAGDNIEGSTHSALCLRLTQLLTRVPRRMRRYQETAAPSTLSP
jgi:hypothetical protein